MQIKFRGRWRSVKISFWPLFTSLLKDESAQDLIEYALVAALIGLGAVTSMKSLAGAISGVLSSVGSRITASI
jgi:pilus assembly protein Flp/PilA